jgi:hypothetical protein
MYRKAQHILLVMALTMGMLLFGIGAAWADGHDHNHDHGDEDKANNCLLGFLCLADERSTFGDSIFPSGD